MDNRICRLLGIKYPIIQGAMQWVSEASLVSAVSNAGGLGILATADRSKEDMRQEIQKIRENTDNPFAVNISMMSSTKEDILELILEEKIALVVTGAGNPAPFIPRFKAAGIKFFSVVGTVKQAQKMEDLGACMVVTEGQEAGGHIGEMTTMTLVPQVASCIKIPVVAAGGIADGRGMAAAFMLGAEGIQMGTAFIATKECRVHANYKQAVIAATSSDIVVTGRRIKDAVRCLNNTLSQGFMELDKNHADLSAYRTWGAGATRKAVVDGDIENGSVMLGQIVGLVRAENSVSTLIQNIIKQYNDLRLCLPEISP